VSFRLLRARTVEPNLKVAAGYSLGCIEPRGLGGILEGSPSSGSSINHVPLRQKGGTMENGRVEELRGELTCLLKKQAEVLESRTFGAASEVEILEYEIRQEVIHEICAKLANPAAA
jgi:hypothetical protein